MYERWSAAECLCIYKYLIQEMKVKRQKVYKLIQSNIKIWRSQWPRGLRHRSAAVRFLKIRVRIPPGGWMSVSFECCVVR